MHRYRATDLACLAAALMLSEAAILLLSDVTGDGLRVPPPAWPFLYAPLLLCLLWTSTRLRTWRDALLVVGWTTACTLVFKAVAGPAQRTALDWARMTLRVAPGYAVILAAGWALARARKRMARTGERDT